jgi:2',3'-cyclic-nucleotide 2'-phosphodiesterase (5'-nucleotidase family)
MSLPYPPALNTIILQAGARGMFAGRLDLSFYNNEPLFHNSAKKVSLENDLHHINQRLTSKETAEVEKVQLRKTKEETERTLNQLRNGNQFTNRILPLQDQMKEDPDLRNLIEAYKAKTRATEPPVLPK